jgi:hypothetical protein
MLRLFYASIRKKDGLLSGDYRNDEEIRIGETSDVNFSGSANFGLSGC